MSIDARRYVDVVAAGTPAGPQTDPDLAAATVAGAIAGEEAGRVAGAAAGAQVATEVASDAGAAAGAAAGEIAGAQAATGAGATAGASAGAAAGAASGTTAGAAAGTTAGAAAGQAALAGRSVNTSGLATGGGALSADRTIAVPGATQTEAQTGTDAAKVMTPLRTTDHFNARVTTALRPVLLENTVAGALTLLGGVAAAALLAAAGANLVGVQGVGTGAVLRTQQDKNRDFSVNAADYATVQQAINQVHAVGGGRVRLNSGIINLGTTGLVMRHSVVLEGAVGEGGSITDRGTRLVYTGTGAAIYGQNIVDSQILNLDIDCNGATGANVRGVHLSGVWKTDLKHVRVYGVSPAKGYGILFDTIGVPSPDNFGAQHNLLEQVECADGIIRLQGLNGSDGVTTTVLDTIRGFQYQIIHSQGVMINATAEGWATGPGYLFDGVGTNFTMLGCNVEGAGSPGIRITNSATMRETGTTWVGFSGALRVDGTTASLRTYGGALEFIAPLVAATPVDIGRYGDNASVMLRDVLMPDNVTGGEQASGRITYRRVGGAEIMAADGRFHGRPKKNFPTSATGQVTLWRVPVINGAGVKLRVTIWGTQSGDGLYLNYRECVVLNNGGTLSKSALAPEILGVNMSLDFAIGTGPDAECILVVANPTTANPSVIQAALEVVGQFGAYS